MGTEGARDMALELEGNIRRRDPTMGNLYKETAVGAINMLKEMQQHVTRPDLEAKLRTLF